VPLSSVGKIGLLIGCRLAAIRTGYFGPAVGLVAYYVLFFIHLESRRVSLPRMTPDPDQEWMEQQARNVTMEEWGFLTRQK
jgi:hypothetical protein